MYLLIDTECNEHEELETLKDLEDQIITWINQGTDPDHLVVYEYTKVFNEISISVEMV